MAYLVLKDTGSKKLFLNSSNEYTPYTQVKTPANPSAGYINLKPFSLSYDIGTNVDSSENITTNISRVSVNSINNTMLTFTCKFNKTITDRTTVLGLSPVDITDSLTYITKLISNRTISLLYWMPDNDSDIINGQATDYYSSQLRVLYSLNWAAYSAVYPKASNGYGGAMSYDCYALPIVITSIVCNEDANSKLIEAQVTGYVVPPE